MDWKTIIFTILAFVISLGLILVPGLSHEDVEASIATNQVDLVYRVYLEGKSIGITRSKEDLEAYIDREQSSIKKKYGVDKVYAPNDLDIVKEYTYDEKLSTATEIYQKIKEIKGPEAFTVNGYKIRIAGVEEETEEGLVKKDDQVLYVLDKEIFSEAMKRTIKAFVDEDDYNNYLNDTQKEIVDTGKIVQNLYIENPITISEERIPTGENIYMEVESLSKYLIFGTVEDQAQYVVKEGDTIEDVSFDNKISTEEFLIANTNFSSKDDLLFPGQVVTLGILSPQFRTVEEDYIVQDKTVPHETKYENDDTQYVGYEKVKQEGQDGLSRVTEVHKMVNGEILATTNITTVEIKPSVDKIIVRGTKQQYTPPSGGGGSWNGEVPVGMGSWVWPTNAPYTISSGFGYRWGKLHEGVDVGGTGYGSPIKAANNGVVVQSGYTGTNGNYIVIAHSNGYYTMYAHMATRYKDVGSTVYAGDVIGLMGKTGFATGVHLHFAIYNGMPYRGGVPMNPFKSVYH